MTQDQKIYFHLKTQNNISNQRSLFVNGPKVFNELPKYSLDPSTAKFKEI
jgi:hypothetical protein